MAKVTGPLLSMRARGQIGSSQVYAQWRGVPYARQYAIPSNPKTAAQSLTRDVFRWLQDVFRNAPALLQTPWIESSAGKPYTDRNRHTQVNLTLLRNEVVATNYLGSPGVRGGPAAADITFTPAAGQVTVDFTAGSLPTGWVVLQAVAAAFLQGDPHDPFVAPIEADADLVAPYSIVLTLAAGTYVVTAWLEYTKPDGAYAASIAETAAVVVT
jgi:hypothetical protein